MATKIFLFRLKGISLQFTNLTVDVISRQTISNCCFSSQSHTLIDSSLPTLAHGVSILPRKIIWDWTPCRELPFFIHVTQWYAQPCQRDRCEWFSPVRIVPEMRWIWTIISCRKPPVLHFMNIIHGSSSKMMPEWEIAGTQSTIESGISHLIVLRTAEVCWNCKIYRVGLHIVYLV